MACSDLAPLTADDIPGALRLSSEAGWNQTAADWRVFITHGATFGVRRENALAATAATLPYGTGFGFVSMVLVTPAQRHRGLGARLVGACIETLRAAALTPVLDATPAGRPVYEKLGFREVYALERWEGEASGAAAAPPPPRAEDLAPIDAAAFGADRVFLLRSFLARPGMLAVVQEDGFALARPGFRAMQIGPIVAGSVKHAVRLLRTLLDGMAGPVFLDIPSRWTCLARFLEQRGFRRQRPFTRMALARSAPFGDASRLFAIAGPEFG
ncbi:MAG: GNAT family N-acetyltransferase [Acetobacteraceae bacterium]